MRCYICCRVEIGGVGVQFDPQLSCLSDPEQFHHVIIQKKTVIIRRLTLTLSLSAQQQKPHGVLPMALQAAGCIRPE